MLAAETLPVGQLLNMSIRQRGRSQKLVKSWLLKTQDITNEAATKEVITNIAVFEQTFSQLSETPPNFIIKASLKKVETSWAIFKKLLEDASNTNAALTISSSNEVLNNCQEVVEGIVKYAKEQNTKGKIKTNEVYAYEDILNITDLCCRQRLHSQKLVLYSTMFASGKPGVLNANKLAIESLETINNNFKKLIGSEITTSEINEELSVLFLEWKKTYDNLKANNYEAIEKKTIDMETLSDQMNKLYNKIDKVITMYSNLLKA